MKRPNPQAVRLNHEELALLDEGVQQVSAKTGERWNRHRLLRTCALGALEALLEAKFEPGGGDALA